MKNFFAYTRVSTAKQGEKGVSLQEQRDAIVRYAQRQQLGIAQWFEERESAAKRGRPVFGQMLRLLRQGKGTGVIIHKIDRGARNLKDWADLGELLDSGMEVHFANESLDLHTRGGRLSADIQAVVAADYIRNLREETKKGLYGRLKQGIYPLGAPIGYLNTGKGKPKEPDPVMAPLVRQAFELYASGRYSLDRLIEEMHRRGLRNRSGTRLSRTGMSTLLNNPFYMGLMRIKRTGQLFPGKHSTLVSKSLFDSVQRILRGKTVDRQDRHHFLFRRMTQCSDCRYSLIGELQKGHVYYRCHTPDCSTSLRQERLEYAVQSSLKQLSLDEHEIAFAGEWMRNEQLRRESGREEELKALKLRLDNVHARLERLTDVFVDGGLERCLFEDRKNALLMEEKDVEEKIGHLEHGDADSLEQVQKYIELAKSASSAYKRGSPEEKRELVERIASNLIVRQKNPTVELRIPFSWIAERAKSTHCAPQRAVPRTWSPLIKRLLDWCKENPAPKPETATS